MTTPDVTLQIKPALSMSTSLSLARRPWFGTRLHFLLAVAVEQGRPRVLAVPEQDADDLQTGDLSTVLQRELRAGRDVMLLSGYVELQPTPETVPDLESPQSVVVLTGADLHVQPSKVDVTTHAVETRRDDLLARLQGLAEHALRRTWAKREQPCLLAEVVEQEASPDVGPDATTTTLPRMTGFDPSLTDLTPDPEWASWG